MRITEERLMEVIQKKISIQKCNCWKFPDDLLIVQFKEITSM